jgi:hypothetical protein
LISSNPRDNYGILGTYEVPAERFQILFPYSVERDRTAWRWSWGCYSGDTSEAAPTTSEMRKMTGKAAELAAILLRLPFQTDFFKQVQDDLLSDGELSLESRGWIAGQLRQLPLLASRNELRRLLDERRGWYIQQLADQEGCEPAQAAKKADETIVSLFAGWRDPLLRRTLPDGAVVTEEGVPLRAMVAYLFGEVAKNFQLIHHPDQWIELVTRSQGGDRCLNIDPQSLPEREILERCAPEEARLSPEERLCYWLERCAASPVDFNRGLGDADLEAAEPPDFARIEGSSFFRGLALIDLAEAMLKRAFGGDAVAVRVNAAGQGDYFQVHVDSAKASPAEVKRFIRAAFYRRFGLSPDREFVEIHPGGGAVGIRLTRYDSIPQLIERLRAIARHGAAAG